MDPRAGKAIEEAQAMARKFKALGIALVAFCGLCMASTAGAQAAEMFKSNVSPTTVSGEQPAGEKHVFAVGSGFGSISCTTAKFTGTVTGKETNEAEFTPTYEGCTDSLGRKAIITTPMVKFVFTATSHTKHLKGTMTIHIRNATDTKTVCTVTVPEQEGVNGINYANAGASNIKMIESSTNIRTITEGGAANCGVANGEHTEGTYKGSVEVSGKDAEGKAATIRYE
jgi:hypothetical protein